MINLPVKFIRGNFDYFLGRLNGVFYEEVRALQLFVLSTITFCTNILCEFNKFLKFKAFCRPFAKGALRATFPLGH